MVYLDSQEIFTTYNEENPPVFEEMLDNIDYSFEIYGKHISSMFFELFSYAEFDLEIAYELAAIVNRLKPKNSIDWSDTFLYFGLGKYNPLGWRLDSPMKELVLKGFGSILQNPGSNCYTVLKGDPYVKSNPKSISLLDEEALEIFIMDTLGVVEILYEPDFL